MMEVFILKNIYLNEQTNLRFSAIYENKKRIDNVNEKVLLKDQLMNLCESLSEIPKKIHGYIIQSLLSEYKHETISLFDLLGEMDRTDLWFKRTGYNKILDILSEFNCKNINDNLFKHLAAVLDNHAAMMYELSNKPMDIKRAVILLNCVREMPYYLEADLDISKVESIPCTKKKIRVTSKKEKFNYKEEVTNDNYYKSAS